jgi:hypothetical protein
VPIDGARDVTGVLRKTELAMEWKSGLWSGRLTVLQNLTEARSCCSG